ncbi:MAG: peptide MFS transporter [Gemmatimonadota bacterium]|nr:peptide MFS transporter [Gemmatimonadota bacterium]
MSAAVDILTTATDRPPALDDRALFGHPRGLGLLFITEMWERFSYYGMRALLILYLTQALRWNTARAANLYGTYTMLVFLTPLIGGYLADRFIGTRRSLVIGGLFIATGHFCLAVSSMTMFYTGLVLIIIGTGFFKPNVSTMVGQIYADGDSRRDAGFTIFYIGINTGAFLGGLVCGYLGDQTRFGDRGWHWGFGAAGVGMLLGLIVYVALRDKYLPGIGVKATKAIPAVGAPIVATDSKALLHGVIGAAAGIAVSVLLGGFDALSAFVAGTIGASLAVTILGSHGEERKRVIAIFIVAFFVVVFWACYEQAGSSMNLFAANNTQLQVGSFHIPAAWSQNVDPAVIVLFAPVFAWIWVKLAKIGREPSTALKMVIGLALLGFGFVFMVIGGQRADNGVLVSPLWLVAAFTFHTWGELCLSPVGLSYVTKVAPVRFASLLMGVWFLANGAANKIAGTIAELTPTPGQPLSAPRGGFLGMLQHIAATNHGFYTIFLIAALSASVLMMFFVPLLKRLTATTSA